MPIDFDKFESDVDKAITNAGDDTSQELASQISSVTRLTDEEIQTLLPVPEDVRKMAELIKIVKSAEDDNVKARRLMDQIQELGEVTIKIIDKLT